MVKKIIIKIIRNKLKSFFKTEETPKSFSACNIFFDKNFQHRKFSQKNLKVTESHLSQQFIKQVKQVIIIENITTTKTTFHVKHPACLRQTLKKIFSMSKLILIKKTKFDVEI